MKRPIRAMATVGVLTVLAVTQSGCLLVAAAAGTGAAVAYVRGDLETTLPAGPEQVADASKAAVEDMKLKLISSQASSVDGEVIARTADDTKVGISIKSQGEKVSKVSIRVGTFGDKDLSVQVLEKIKGKLPKA